MPTTASMKLPGWQALTHCFPMTYCLSCDPLFILWPIVYPLTYCLSTDPLFILWPIAYPLTHCLIRSIVYPTTHCLSNNPLFILWPIVYYLTHCLPSDPLFILWTIAYPLTHCLSCDPLFTLWPIVYPLTHCLSSSHVLWSASLPSWLFFPCNANSAFSLLGLMHSRDSVGVSATLRPLPLLSDTDTRELHRTGGVMLTPVQWPLALAIVVISIPSVVSLQHKTMRSGVACRQWNCVFVVSGSKINRRLLLLLLLIRLSS